jgi:hypothetical protein
MTERKHLKRRVRERARKTGESYTAALWNLRRAEEAATITTRVTPDPRPFTLECSFCGKQDDQVQKLVAGPGVFICDECAALAVSIVEAELGQPTGERVALADRPTDELLAIFGGMAGSARRRTAMAAAWARALARRGVTDAQLAEAAGATIDEIHAQTGG